MRKRALRLFGGFAVLTLLAGGVAHARTQTFTSSVSGTLVNIPLDLDADSCTTSGGVTVCTDYSAYFTFSSNTTGIIGSGTGQAVEEYDPVSGSGCTIMGAPAPIAGCTLTGSSERGCKLKSVASALVLRANATGDLLFETESTTVCIDLSSSRPPFNNTAAAHGKITGGTGMFSGATGSFTAVAHGQELVSDPAGHGFAWFKGNSTGTITTP
jgi:hypothetical protein